MITLEEILFVEDDILLKEYTIFELALAKETYSKQIKDWKNGYQKPKGRPKKRNCSNWSMMEDYLKDTI